MYNNTLLKRVLSFLLCLVMVLSYLPAGMLKTAAAEQPLNIVSNSKKADAESIIW